MLPLAEGEDGRHGLAGSKTAVVLGVEERVPRVRCAHAHRTGLGRLRGPDPALADASHDGAHVLTRDMGELPRCHEQWDIFECMVSNLSAVASEHEHRSLNP